MRLSARVGRGSSSRTGKAVLLTCCERIWGVDGRSARAWGRVAASGGMYSGVLVAL